MTQLRGILWVRITGQTSVIVSVIVHFCYRQPDRQDADEASDNWKKPHVSGPWSSWGTAFTPVSAGVTVQQGTSNLGGFWRAPMIS